MPQAIPKSKKGSVSVLSQKSMLRLRWRILNTEQRPVLPLGLPDTISNLRKAELLAKQIEVDMEQGTYDTTLQKYKELIRPKNFREMVDSQGESAADLLESFITFKAQTVDERTIETFNALLTRVRDFFKSQRAEFVSIEKAKQFIGYLGQYQKPRTI